MVKRAGANAVTVMGSSPIETLNLFVDRCEQLGMIEMIDMLGVRDPLKVLMNCVNLLWLSFYTGVVMRRAQDVR